MMRHVEQQITWIEELVRYFESNNKIWFTRKMNRLPPEQRDEVWTVLQGRGHKRPTQKQKKEKEQNQIQIQNQNQNQDGRMFWTEEEWDQIAKTVWRARKNDPSGSLVSLTRKVMDIFPKNRRRNIRTAKDIKPLIERLRLRDQELSTSDDDLQFYKLQVAEFEAKQKQVPSREQVFSDLNDEEILNRFSEKVLQNCSPQDVISRFSTDAMLSSVPAADAIGYYLKLGIEMFMSKQNQLVNAIRELTATMKGQAAVRNVTVVENRALPPLLPSMPNPKPKTQLSKVTVIGLLPNQQSVVQEALSGRAIFNFLNKNRKPDSSVVPDGQDFVVLAANFITHSMQEAVKKRIKGTNTKLIVHHGGVETMVRKLDDVLPDVLELV